MNGVNAAYPSIEVLSDQLPAAGTLRPLHTENLDFVGYRRPVVHAYPATMPMPLANALVARYSGPGDVVFDPFLGSGTTLFSAVSAGRIGIGCDTNPLACLIAEVTLQAACSPLPLDTYLLALERVGGLMARSRRGLLPPVHYRPLISRWFERESIRKLGLIARAISRAEVPPAQRAFLMLAFSRTVRRSSLARTSEIKLWKRPAGFKLLDPFVVFSTEARRLLSVLQTLNSVAQGKEFGPSKVLVMDAYNAATAVRPVDLILTSPPYGDSWTTVAYGNFTLLSKVWLGAIDGSFLIEDPVLVDEFAPGGHRRQRPAGTQLSLFSASPYLARTLEQIRERDPQRSGVVLSFYHDMYLILEKLVGNLGPSGRFVIVTGPRMICGIPLSTSHVMAELLASLGLSLEDHTIRTISGKRMPTSTMQGNGMRLATINSEAVDVFRRA